MNCRAAANRSSKISWPWPPLSGLLSVSPHEILSFLLLVVTPKQIRMTEMCHV